MDPKIQKPRQSQPPESGKEERRENKKTQQVVVQRCKNELVKTRSDRHRYEKLSEIKGLHVANKEADSGCVATV